MNVDIPLASNQVLTNNGIYNVVQGQNGLEFQQQQQSRGLPDPTGTSIGQFNVNISTPTPTASQKVLNLTENTTSSQTIYPPTGEYWDSIKYTVNVPTTSLITINKVKIGNNVYSLSTFTRSTGSVTISSGYSLIQFSANTSSSLYWTVKLIRNKTSNSITENNYQAYYKLFENISLQSSVTFLSNTDEVFELYDFTASNYTGINFYKSLFNFVH